MAIDTKDPNKRFSDSKLDPSQSSFDEIVGTPEMRALDDQMDATAHTKGNTLAESENEAGRTTSGAAKKPDPTNSESNPDGYWRQNTNDSTQSRIRGTLSGFRKNRKALIATGVTGGLIVAIMSAFFSLLPLKLEMLIKTATDQAADIPEYMIEKRIRYLTQYYVASRILGQAYGQDIDVGKGSIMAGTFQAWKAANYEKKLGFTIESDRMRPGESAFNWRLRDLDGNPLKIDGKLVNGTSRAGPGGIREVVSELNGSSEFRGFLNTQTKSATHWNQYYKRYAMRKTLMRKFGVARWSWLPDKASDKLDSYAERKRALTRDLRQRMYDNTIGRVKLKTGQYFSCLTEGSEECKKLKEDVQSDADIRAQQDDSVCAADDKACAAEADKNKQAMDTAAQQEKASVDAANSAAGEVDLGSSDSKTISKLISKQMLAKVAGGIGLVDTIMRMVNSVENGALNQVMFDRNSTAYIGYSSELLAINDQMKSGEIDIAQVGAMMEMIGDFGSSPAWQEEAGILSPQTVASSQYARECSTDDPGQETTLPKGQTVCSDRKVVYEKNPFEGEAWWEGLANVASAYMHSIGALVGWFNDAVGGIANVLGFDDLMKALHIDALVGKGMKLLLGMVYGAPITGQEQGPDAGDNVLGGIQSSYFALGQTGQDMGSKGDGGGLGIGGSVTDTAMTAALEQQIKTEKTAENDKRSMMAKLFDTSSSNSFVSQVALRTPSSLADIASLPHTLASSLSRIINPSLSAASQPKNAFGFDFAYSFSDSELNADPMKYTDETCKQYNDEREASYGKTDKYPIMVYTKSDPCALEKVVAASAQSAFVSGPPQYFDLFNMSDTSTTTGGSKFNIATFNVLGASHSDADYQDRMDRSIKVLTDNDINIVGFQEFQSKQRAYFREQAGSKYELFDKSSGTEHTTGGEGVNAIGWDKSKFQLVSSGFMPNLVYFSGGNLDAPWIKLQDINTQQQFYVLNTHDPAHPENTALRTQDAKQHVDFIDTLKKEGLPIFFTGDFNSGYEVRDASAGNPTLNNDPENLTYCILTKGGMHDAYDLAEKRDVKCPNPGNNNSVDHIYLTDESEVTHYWTSPGGRLKNGSDVHDTHMASIVIPGAVTGGDWPGGTLRIGTYNMRVGSSDAWHEAATSNMKNNNYDVVGMQEIASAGMFRDIAQRLRSKGYETYPKQVDNNVSEAAIQGRTIAYRTDKYEFVKADEVTFTRMGTNREQPAHSPIVWLKDKATGQVIVVLNTHNPAGGSRGLTADDGFPYDGPAQRYAADQVYIDKLTAIQAEGFPLFVTGDFNEGYGPGTQGSDNYRELFHCMADSKKILKAVEIRNPEEYCKAGGRTGAIDHLYASPQVKVDKFGELRGTSSQLGTDHARSPYADLVIPKTDTGSGAAVGDWAWPVDRKWWESNRADFLAPHISTGTAWGGDNMGTSDKGSGIAADIGDPPDGSPVYAMLSGVVTSTNLCGANDGIAIKSKLGDATVGIAYMHGTGKKFSVGDTVNAGDRIMSIGTIGCNVNGGHVHIGIAYNGKYVCPQDVFLAMGAGKTPDLGALTSKGIAPCGR